MQKQLFLDSQPHRAATHFIQFAHLAQETLSWVSSSTKDTRFAVQEACQRLIAAANNGDGFQMCVAVPDYLNAMREHFNSSTNRDLRERAQGLFAECEGVYYDQRAAESVRAGDRVLVDDESVREVAAVVPATQHGEGSWHLIFKHSVEATKISTLVRAGDVFRVETPYARQIRAVYEVLDAFYPARRSHDQLRSADVSEFPRVLQLLEHN